MTLATEKLTSNREVKSSAFTTLFGEPENAAKLYAALDDSEDVRPEDIQFTTLAGVLFMARKNDMAFTVKNKVLVISEHQSTINLNMPIRDAIYYGRTLEKLIEPRSLYRHAQIPLPMPEFYVFYNGNENCPPEQILKLSDAYLDKTNEPMLELKVKIININLPQNHPLLEKCRPLYEYSWFIQRIKEYLHKGKNRDEAIIQSMADCRDKGILLDFIAEHGTEAINMLFTEFNMEDALDVRYEEGVEAGIAKGRTEGELRKLIEQVSRKLQKGKSVTEIADALEETEENIQKICAVAASCAPEYDIDTILSNYKAKETINN